MASTRFNKVELLSLPAEVQINIVERLDKKDLKSIGAVNKSFRALIISKLFSTFTVYPHSTKLRQFVALSKHHSIARLLKEVRIDLRWNALDDASLRYLDNTPKTEHSARYLQRRFDRYSDLEAVGPDLMLAESFYVSQAFQKLVNTRTLHLVSLDTCERPRCMDHRCGQLRLRRARLLSVRHHANLSKHPDLSQFLLAVTVLPAGLQNLHIEGPCFTTLFGSTLPGALYEDYLPALLQLRSLSICLCCCACQNWTDGFTVKKQVRLHMIFDHLKHLERLDLSFDHLRMLPPRSLHGSYTSPSMTLMDTSLGSLFTVNESHRFTFPFSNNLKTLRLDRFCCRKDELQGLLAANSASLKLLTLSNLVLMADYIVQPLPRETTTPSSCLVDLLKMLRTIGIERINLLGTFKSQGGQHWEIDPQADLYQSSQSSRGADSCLLLEVETWLHSSQQEVRDEDCPLEFTRIPEGTCIPVGGTGFPPESIHREVSVPSEGDESFWIKPDAKMVDDEELVSNFGPNSNAYGDSEDEDDSDMFSEESYSEFDRYNGYHDYYDDDDLDFDDWEQYRGGSDGGGAPWMYDMGMPVSLGGSRPPPLIRAMGMGLMGAPFGRERNEGPSNPATGLGTATTGTAATGTATTSGRGSRAARGRARAGRATTTTTRGTTTSSARARAGAASSSASRTTPTTRGTSTARRSRATARTGRATRGSTRGRPRARRG